MTQQLPPGQGPIDPRGAFTQGQFPGGVAGGPPRGPMPPPGGPWMYPPFLPPPRRGGALRIIFILILIVALAVSILINVMQSGDSSSTVAQVPSAEQTVLVQGDMNNRVAVVPVDGLIDDMAAARFDLMMTNVEKEPSVKALVIEIDTPGGSASSSAEMYHRVEHFKQKMADAGRKVPVVIAMRGMATSGGYYLSCAGDYLFAEDVTLTGNIGVIFPRVNISKLIEKYGIEEATLTATTTGKSYKNAGSMLKPEDPADEKYLQGLIDDLFAEFQKVVNTGRQGKLKDTQGDIFSGKAFGAKDALARGLIDEIGQPEKAYDKAASLAGINKPSVVRFTPEPSLLQKLLSESKLSGIKASGSNDVNIDGVRIDGQLLGELLSSRPMMLWRSN